MATDQRKVLEGEPFDFKETKDGKVMLFFEGRQVEMLTGKEADKFLFRPYRKPYDYVRIAT